MMGWKDYLPRLSAHQQEEIEQDEQEHEEQRQSTDILTWLGILILFAFSAWQTRDALLWILPPGEAVAAYLAIIAFDGGFLHWSLKLRKPRLLSKKQLEIVSITRYIDLAGAGLCLVGNLWRNMGNEGWIQRIDPAWVQTFVVAIGLILLWNIWAGIEYHLARPTYRYREASPPTQPESPTRIAEGQGFPVYSQETMELLALGMAAKNGFLALPPANQNGKKPEKV